MASVSERVWLPRLLVRSENNFHVYFNVAGGTRRSVVANASNTRFALFNPSRTHGWWRASVGPGGGVCSHRSQHLRPRAINIC